MQRDLKLMKKNFVRCFKIKQLLNKTKLLSLEDY